MKNIKDKLIKAYEKGGLLELINEIHYQDGNGEEILPSLLIDLHNEGKIDLVKFFNSFKETSRHNDFFLIRRVFEKVLPHLNASVIEVAVSVRHLTLEAGEGMATYMLLPPFREFCQKDSNRAKEFFYFSITKANDEFDYLSSAIEAGAVVNEKEYVDKAIELLGDENEKLKQRVILALGRISYQDKSLLEPVLVAIMESVDSSSDGEILAISMRSLFSITSQSQDLENLFIDFLAVHSGCIHDRYVHAASEILFYDAKKLNSRVESILLDICCHADSENKGAIDNIDFALERLLSRNGFDECVNFLERFFESSEYRLSIKYFDSFIRELHKHQDTYLSSLLTKWMLSKNFQLCKFCYELMQDFDEDIIVGFDMSCIPDDGSGMHLFLSRKACGWFFNQPKTAISLIESLIPGTPENDLEFIRELIFNPLCISYPGSIKERMEELRNSSQGRAVEIAIGVLSDYEKYHDSVKSALNINELKPSEQDRHTYWRHHNSLMEETMKQARSQSLLTSLFGEGSVLLYGNKSIYYINHGDNKTRQELPLQEFSHSIEFASMHNLDPLGLENMIWQFRAEGCVS